MKILETKRLILTHLEPSDLDRLCCTQSIAIRAERFLAALQTDSGLGSTAARLVSS